MFNRLHLPVNRMMIKELHPASQSHILHKFTSQKIPLNRKSKRINSIIIFRNGVNKSMRSMKRMRTISTPLTQKQRLRTHPNRSPLKKWMSLMVWQSKLRPNRRFRSKNQHPRLPPAEKMGQISYNRNSIEERLPSSWERSNLQASKTQKNSDLTRRKLLANRPVFRLKKKLKNWKREGMVSSETMKLMDLLSFCELESHRCLMVHTKNYIKHNH